MKFECAGEVYAKADWEGGLYELITSYGVTADDLPDSFPQEIVDAWNRIAAISGDEALIMQYLEANLDEED
jgi:hypothetical protein